MWKAKKDHFTKLDISSATDYKSFWQTVKPAFSNKANSHRILNLVKKDTLIHDDKKTAQICNEYFSNIAQKLGVIKFKTYKTSFRWGKYGYYQV